jgi:hypothetical protein
MRAASLNLSAYIANDADPEMASKVSAAKAAAVRPLSVTDVEFAMVKLRESFVEVQVRKRAPQLSLHAISKFIKFSYSLLFRPLSPRYSRKSLASQHPAPVPIGSCS